MQAQRRSVCGKLVVGVAKVGVAGVVICQHLPTVRSPPTRVGGAGSDSRNLHFNGLSLDNEERRALHVVALTQRSESR